MVGTLDIFDSIVDEALFANLAEATEGDVAAVIAALKLIVDALPSDYLSTHVTKALPPHVEDEGEIILNPILSDHRAFAPLYVALAKFFYETVAPVTLNAFPVTTLRADAEALFGIALAGMADTVPSGDEDVREESLGLFAGCVALAVNTCLKQPVSLVLAYMLAVVACEPLKMTSTGGAA